MMKGLHIILTKVKYKVAANFMMLLNIFIKIKFKYFEKYEL